NQIRNLGFSNSREARTWQIGIYNSITGEMLQPQVIWTAPDGSRRWLFADRAVRTNESWTFYNAREFLEPPNAMLAPSLQTNVLVMPNFRETPQEIQSEINISRGMTLLGRNKADIPISQILDYLHLHPRPVPAIRPWIKTKLQGRFAAPWTCLVVVLIAIPFGAASGRRNVFVGVASSIFICFSYFMILKLGLALGTGGYVPPWLAAWSPNIVFAGTGLFLTRRDR